jgi:hypothetical protein
MARTIPMLLVACGLFGVTIEAHHSIAAVYDSTQPVKIDGVVTAIQFINPHPFVFVDARDYKGTVQSWRLEMDNLRELSDIGFTADTLKQGDRVVVTGHLARREPRGLYIRTLDRPADGFRYEQIGFSPTIRRSTR